MNTVERQLCVIFGAGGHAGVLLDALQTSTVQFEFVMLDADPGRKGGEILGVPILGNDSLLPELKRRGAARFVVGVGSTGDTSLRQHLYESALVAGLVPLQVGHPSAICSPSARLGEGVQLLAGCIVNIGTILGVNTIINTGAIVEHDCRVGSHVHIASGATVCGSVTIGDGAHIGAGATVRQGIVIGRHAVVGAGSVVIKDVPEGMVVAGVPARSLEKRNS
jgi:UDP-perosamine 4-acetyltransferase